MMKKHMPYKLGGIPDTENGFVLFPSNFPAASHAAASAASVANESLKKDDSSALEVVAREPNDIDLFGSSAGLPKHSYFLARKSQKNVNQLTLC